MGWFTVTFMSVAAGMAAWQFSLAPGEDTLVLVGWAALFLSALGGITIGKVHIFAMQAHLGLRRDVKRAELRLAERSD